MFIILLICSILNQSTNAWDLAVSSDDRLDLLSHDGKILRTIKAPEISEAHGLTFDPIENVVYFSSLYPDSNGTFIFSISLDEHRNQTVTPIVATVGGAPRPSVQSLAYDPVEHAIYWTDDEARTINQAKIRDDGPVNTSETTIIQQFQYEIPHGLVLDHCRRTLYWSNENRRHPSIEKANLSDNKRLIITTDKLYYPRGLFLDLENNYLYWVNDREGIHFSMERIHLNATNLEILIQSTSHKPYSLAVVDSKVFWTDTSNQAVWKIDISTHVSKRKEEMLFTISESSPHSIIAYREDIDCNSVLKNIIENNIPEITTKASVNLELQNWTSATPIDILDNEPSLSTNTWMSVPTQTTYTWKPVTTQFSYAPESVSPSKSLYCLSGGTFKSTGICECPVGYMGSRCEQHVCHNYCLNEGDCKSDAVPSCNCRDGYSGIRCEIDLCKDFCLNDGHCQVTSNNTEVMCLCGHKYTGARCEIRTDDKIEECNSTKNIPCLCENQPFISDSVLSNNTQNETLCGIPPQSFNQAYIYVMALSTICAGLILIVILLGYKIVKLSKRPKIRRRFIVNRKDMPLASGNNANKEQDKRGKNGGPAADTCEITIENCCNMNICETPCFEPPVRTPSKKTGKKEEKKTLLNNMEESEDTVDSVDEYGQ